MLAGACSLEGKARGLPDNVQRGLPNLLAALEADGQTAAMRDRKLSADLPLTRVVCRCLWMFVDFYGLLRIFADVYGFLLLFF